MARTLTRDQSQHYLRMSLEKGAKVRPARQPGVTLVSSERDPRVWYRVSAQGCPCKGYQYRQVCSHYVRAAFENRYGALSVAAKKEG